MTLTSRYPLPSLTVTSSKASDYFHLSLIKLRTSDLIYSLMYALNERMLKFVEEQNQLKCLLFIQQYLAQLTMCA